MIAKVSPYKTKTPSKHRIGSATVWMEESPALPLVDVEVLLRQCAWHDQVGKEGTSRALARMLRMGTLSLSASALEEAIERLGASLSLEATHSALRVRGTVLSRNIGPFLALLGEVLTQPAFRKADLAKVKGEIVADIRSGVDNDRWIAWAAFRQFLFGAHAYGRVLGGTEASMRALTLADVEAAYSDASEVGHPVLSLTGAVSEGALELLQVALHPLLPARRGKPLIDRPPPSRAQHARRLLLITKPDRSQSQIVIGSLGLEIGDEHQYPLMIANAAFGGTFTSRLMREVRSARGFSYSASSKIGADRRRDAFTMMTHPSTENTVACIDLQLRLADEWVRRGITAKELSFVKASLEKSHAFDLDTPQKRVDPYVDATLHGLAPEVFTEYLPRVRAVRLEQVHTSLKERIDPASFHIVVLGDAKLEPALRKAAKSWGVSDFRVGAYDSVLTQEFAETLK